jgi:hypothetical protein
MQLRICYSQIALWFLCICCLNSIQKIFAIKLNKKISFLKTITNDNDENIVKLYLYPSVNKFNNNTITIDTNNNNNYIDNKNSNNNLYISDKYKKLFTKLNSNNETVLTYYGLMLSGAIARSIAATCVHPFNVIKTVLQRKNGVMPDMHWRVLTRGVGSQFIMSVPHGALNFAITEVLQYCFNITSILLALYTSHS